MQHEHATTQKGARVPALGRPTRRAVAAALGLSALAACTDSSSSSSSKGSAAQGSSSAAKSASPAASDEAALATARGQAAHYDYDGALATLKDATSPDAVAFRDECTRARDALVPWPADKEVPHLFFHTLIVDASLAFRDPSKAKDYDEYMCTIPEFTACVQQLYDRGFVLVSPHDLAGLDGSGTMVRRELRLPAGKTPLVLSQDDVSYYEYMTGDGYATTLKIADDGHITNTYAQADGTVKEGSYDMVPLLDDFVAQHPDFSYRGRKGILCMTGYNGVFGYRTSQRKYGTQPGFADAVAQAKKVADALKQDGWEMASHSWGHIDTTKSTPEQVATDSDRWHTEVEPILGATDLYVFPFGADIGGSGPYTRDNPKFAQLRDRGFTYFFPIDGLQYAWEQMEPEYFRQMRMNVDGIRLKRNAEGKETSLRPFFDVNTVLDRAARPAIGY